ncbi:16774_t:CDS:2 [Funneliformis mosseae]|uniref:Protein YAE1 n=1 Tax=Funneliformis mosseae TaxID=27381 RepID=A0A9N8YSC9_FUNMO|nr:16774_t:CDS:2 [Funneliformis mosseae]
MLSESDDDVWASDEEISEYDRIMSLKEWERMNENFGNVGYKEGILEGKDVTIQDGFNDGYVEGVNLGMEFGRLRGLLNTLLEFYTPMMNEEDNDELKIQNLPNRSTFERLKLLENDLYNLTAEKVFTKDYLQTILTSQNDKCSCLSETTNTVNDNCCSRNISCESKEIYNLGNNIKSNENFTEKLLIDYREKVDKLLEELGFDKNSV